MGSWPGSVTCCRLTDIQECHCQPATLECSPAKLYSTVQPLHTSIQYNLYAHSIVQYNLYTHSSICTVQPLHTHTHTSRLQYNLYTVIIPTPLCSKTMILVYSTAPYVQYNHYNNIQFNPHIFNTFT